MTHSEHTRRSFLSDSGSCAAWIMGLAALWPVDIRRAFAQTAKRKIVAKEPWGRLEEVAPKVWALISTPFESRDFTTVSNGGIIAGTDRVIVVEALNQPKGATWLAERAKQLTGRWPSDVIVTHYHSDHSAGSVGFRNKDIEPQLWLTQATLKLINEKYNSGGRTREMLKTIKEVPAGRPTKIDLGGRQVLVATHAGHTPSDITIEISEPNVLFCGDLFFNRLVPNYADAIPSRLKQSVAGFKREKETLFVPGHGNIATPADLATYREFLDMMEDAARTSHRAGTESAAAAASFKLPERFAKWYIFSPQVIPRAFAAWYRELDA